MSSGGQNKTVMPSAASDNVARFSTAEPSEDVAAIHAAIDRIEDQQRDSAARFLPYFAARFRAVGSCREKIDLANSKLGFRRGRCPF